MNYKDYLDQKAREFWTIMQCTPGSKYIPTEPFGWENHRYESDLFRLAHMERYSDDKIEVLHVTTFPHKNDTAPIFGFDVIATESRVLGCYLDFSPTLADYNLVKLGYGWQNTKEIPEWAGDIFSNEFMLINPKNNTEFIKFCTVAIHNYILYCEKILGKQLSSDKKIIELQNKYCTIQASNPRTYNVLKGKIGDQRAKYFMEEILFPKIK